jgi:nitroreductase
MDTLEAIRLRRSVRSYTDRPVPDEVLDRLLRLALTAPTGSMAQAWSLVVVRDRERARAIGQLVIEGGAIYFAMMRPPKDGATPEEHREWARGYAEERLASYRIVPVWIAAVLVPRRLFPPEERERERISDLTSISFAMENLFVGARALGLGTVPTVFHWWVEDRLRALLDIPAEHEIPTVTPLGYPTEFPTALPPALKAIRRPWRTLVHDERWGNPRQAAEAK